MMRVGFVGWRGMVGSVLMGRMNEEKDFDLVDPVFFTSVVTWSNIAGRSSVASVARGCTTTDQSSLPRIA